MALSKNFEIETSRREKPSCFGKYKTTLATNKVKCGTCWFCHKCKAKIESKKSTAKKVSNK